MTPKTSFLTKISKDSLKTLAIIILLIIFLNLLDEFMTFYAFWYAPFTGIEEVGPLTNSNRTINPTNVVGSTIFTIIIILFILTIGKLWQYRIVRFFLWVLLVGEIILLVHNFCYGYINGYTQILIPSPQSLLKSLVSFARSDLIPFLPNIFFYIGTILLFKYYYCHRNKQ